MIYEYAIEPEVVATWGEADNYRYFIDKIGLGTTRIVSRFPKKWKKSVYEAFAEIKKNVPDNEKKQAELQHQEKRLEAIVERISEQSIRRVAQTQDLKNWKDAVILEHNNLSFHAVICNEGYKKFNFIITPTDLISAAHTLWVNEVEKDVPRNAISIGKELAPLLKISKKIKIIDPYFRASRPKWINVFREIFRHIRSGMHQLGDIEIELIASLEVHNCPVADFYKEECLRYLTDIVPQGLKLTIMRWGHKNNGEKLHNRYILTEFGGIKLDPGFDESLSVGAHTEFTVLGKKRYSLRWRQYASNASEFNMEIESPFIIEGNR